MAATVSADEGFSENVYPFGRRDAPRPESSTPPDEDSPPGNTSPASSTSSPERVAPGDRRRRRWPVWSVVGVVLLVAAGVLLVVWRPWERGADRVTRQLGVGGYSADVPRDWELWRRPGIEGQTVLAPADWSGIFLGEPSARRDASLTVQRDPESVVGLYVAERPLLDARDPIGQRDQIQATLPSATIAPPGEPTQLAGRDTSTFDGTLQLASGEVLHLHLYLMEGLSPVLLVFFAPAELDHAWVPTFREVTTSIRE
ncbi:hypothetical protein [Geodermatophilus sp. URMC 64]